MDSKTDSKMLSVTNLSKSHSSEKVYSEDDSSMEQPVWEDDGLPPSYDSIFNQLKDAKESPENAIGFLKKAMHTFAGTIGCTAALMLLLALPAAMIIIGMVPDISKIALWSLLFQFTSLLEVHLVC